MLIVASARRDFQPSTGAPRSTMDEYIKEEDSKIVSIQAARSYLPTSDHLRSSSGASTQSIRTSLMVGQDSSINNSSLPPLSRTRSPHATESVSTGMGSRDQDQDNRTLREPWRLSSLRCPCHVLDCQKEFNISQEKEWVKHSLTHFVKKPRHGRDPVRVQPPTHCRCYFCGAEFRAASGNLCWRDRMRHIQLHHEHEGPDQALIKYLWEAGIMGTEVKREILPKQGLPTPPSSDDGKSPIAFRGETR